MGCSSSKRTAKFPEIVQEIANVSDEVQLSLVQESEISSDLIFSVVLADIRITRHSVPVRLEISGFDQVMRTPWSSSGHFPGIVGRASLVVGESLRSKQAVLRVFVQPGRTAAEVVELNLETLAAGPALHDLQMGSFGRVSFSLKLTQHCQLLFPIRGLHFAPRPAEADLSLAEVGEFPGVGAVAAEETVKVSVSLGTSSCLFLPVSDEAVAREGERGKGALLKVTASADRLRTESFRFQVGVMGEVWIPLARLYETSSGFASVPPDGFASDRVGGAERLYMKEKVWHEGRWIGYLEIIAGNFLGFPKYVQMSFGVYTGATGVTRSSAPLTEVLGGGSGETAPVQIMRLTGLLDRLQSSEDKSQVGNELSEVLAQGRRPKGYDYGSEEAWTVGEGVMLQLGELLFRTLSLGKLTWTQSQMYARLLETVLNRPEIDGLLALPNGVITTMATTSATTTSATTTTRRIEIRIRYREWVEEMMKWSLEVLDKKRAYDLYEAHKELIPAILVRGYFIFPPFREALLRAVADEKEGDEEIEEWRGSGFALWPAQRLFEDSSKASRSIKLLFDLTEWNSILDQASLKKAADTPASHDVVSHMIGSHDVAPGEAKREEKRRWEERMSKKKTTFCFFVKTWLRVVGDASDLSSGGMAGTQLFWHHIPGYRVLLKGVLLALKRRRVDEIPDALVNAASGFLRNPKTLSVLVKMVLHRTNEYEQQAVLACVKVLDYLFLNVEVRKLEIPVDFDFPVFFNACNRLLYSEGAKNVYNLIWLLYRHFPLFVSDRAVDFARQGVLELFMKPRTFQHLLTHWAWFVRDRFVLLTLFRFGALEAVEQADTQSAFGRFRLALTRTLAKNLANPFQVEVTAFMALSKALPVFAGPAGFSAAERQYLACSQEVWRELLPKFRSHMALDEDERKRGLPGFALAEVVDLDLRGDSDSAVTRKNDRRTTADDEDELDE